MLRNEGGLGAGVFCKPHQISVHVYVWVGVHVGIHVCVRESHMCMDARGQPQLSVLGAMHFF